MKTLFAILLFSATIASQSQTQEIEIENLKNLAQKEEINIDQYKRYAIQWRDLMEEMGGYPNLPFDSNYENIVFHFTDNVNTPKTITYNRILEWAAINFGSLSSVLHYKDYETGKIILKGFFEVPHKKDYKNFWGTLKETIASTKCFQTYIFTIKEDKIKLQIINMEYEFLIPGFNSNTLYIPDRYIITPIYQLYPVTQYKPEYWKQNLDLLQQSNNKIILLHADLIDYIGFYEADYSF